MLHLVVSLLFLFMEHHQTDPFADLESVIGVGQVDVSKNVQDVQPNWSQDSYGVRGPQKSVVRPIAESEPMVFEQDSKRRIADVPLGESQGCPCVIFNDVEFCCVDGSFSFAEPPSLNGIPFCQAGSVGVGPPCPICTNDDNCDGTIDAGSILIGVTDCVGGPPFAVDNIFIYSAFIDGVWHIMAYGASTFGIMFYGTTTGVDVPADNEVVCDGALHTWDNPLTDCVFGGPIDFYNAGFNGTATLGPCPTGACCFGVDCFENYHESPCIYEGGTYIGDDTICTPNPC